MCICQPQEETTQTWIFFLLMLKLKAKSCGTAMKKKPIYNITIALDLYFYCKPIILIRETPKHCLLIF